MEVCTKVEMGNTDLFEYETPKAMTHENNSA